MKINKKKLVQVNVPTELYEKFEAIAKTNYKNVSELVRELMITCVLENEKDANNE